MRQKAPADTVQFIGPPVKRARRIALACVVSMVTAITALVGFSGGSVAAQDVPPVNSPELDALIADLKPFLCPTLPSMVVVEPFPVTDTSLGRRVDGDVYRPLDSAGIRCQYRAPADPAAPTASISFQAYLKVGQFSAACPTEPADDRSNGISVRDRLIREDANVRVSYAIEPATLALVPTFEAEVLANVQVQVDALAPFATLCQLVPVVLTCPPITGLTAREPDQANRADLLEGGCDYSTDDVSSAAQLYVSWATVRSDLDAVQYSCYDPGEQHIASTGDIVAPGQSAAVVWLSRIREQPAIDAVREAAQALLAQVVPQAATCDGVEVAPMWTPLPPYLAEVYAPERIAGTPIITDRPPAAPAPEPVAAIPPTTVTPTTLAAEPTPVPATTVDPAAPDPAAGQPGAAPPTETVTTAGSSWVTTVLRVLSIVMLVVSILGLALAFFMMRKESRVRPRIDIARVVIVLIVAVVSVLVFAKGAPIWAVVVAIAVGGAIGFLQGTNLTMRSAGEKIYAKRTPIALLAFGAGLIVTQIAGLANRTGAIAFGLALSFLSAAMTGGLIAGRRPKLAEARRAGMAALLIAVLVGGLLLAAIPPGTGLAQSDDPAPPLDEPPVETIPIEDRRCRSVDPDRRCLATEHLMSLVDWSQVEFTAGLYQSNGKPPFLLNVPPALDSPPADLTQAITWSETSSNGTLSTYSVNETIGFTPTIEGVCCDMTYSGSGSLIVGDRPPVLSVAEGQLHELQTVGGFATASHYAANISAQGLPFTAATLIGNGDAARCVRYVAGSPGNMSQNGTFTTLTRDGEDLREDTRAVKAAGLTSMTIPCEVPGFTYDDAVAMFPEAEPDRSTGCPLRKELVPALVDGGLPMTATKDIGELFLQPDEEMCKDGGLLGPLQFGGDQRGDTRSEFAFEYATPEAQTVWGDPSALYDDFRPSAAPPSRRCAVDELGRPLRVAEGQRCELRTMHQVGDGWISIEYDNQLSDGPNTRVRATLPWGSYWYRCHHCQPDDPEISRFLGQFHDFSSDYTDAVIAEAIANAPPPPPSTVVEDIPVTTAVPTPETDVLAEEAAALGIDPELAELFVEDDADDEARAAALAALVGLVGSLGLAGTALAESGLSASELAGRFREDGVGGLRDALDEQAAAEAEHEATRVVDERGESLYPDDDGLYEWDDRRVSRQDLEELIAAEQAARDAQEARIERLTDAYDDEAAIRTRFDGLTDRSIAQNDELMAEIREGWDNVDDMQSFLDERARVLAELEAAEAIQERDAEHLGWDIAYGALAGAGEELAGLPGEIVDATRIVVQATVNWENDRMVLETVAETIYDVAGIMTGGLFGDGVQSIADGTVAVGSAVARDPSIVTMLIPGRDLLDITDENRTLGGRLASLGLGLVDVYGVGSGLGILSGGDELVGVGRAAGRAGDALETGVDTTRASGAATDARLAAEATETATDTSRGANRAVTSAGRVPDEALDPMLVQTRNQVDDAIAAAEREAARRTRETGRIPPFTAAEVAPDVPEVRSLYQGAGAEGMERLAALEAAGGIDPNMSSSLLGMYDEITGAATRTGATDAFDDLARLEGVQPREVMIGDSGSTGLGRSVYTDADRTVLTVFDDAQLDGWAARNGMSIDDDAVRAMARREGISIDEARAIALREQRRDAAQALNQRYRDLHQRNVELALNDPSDPAVQLARAGDMSLDDAIARRQAMGFDDSEFAARRVSADNVGVESYADIGSPGGGGPADSYSRGVTAGRQSTQGRTTRIAPRLNADGTTSLTSYSTDGAALIERSELEQLRHTGEMATNTTRRGLPANDVTRMTSGDFAQTLDQQRQALSHYDDVKSVSKAVTRMNTFGTRGENAATFGQLFGDSDKSRNLVAAAAEIRGDPSRTADVLRRLDMSNDEYVEAIQAMVRDAPGAAT